MSIHFPLVAPVCESIQQIIAIVSTEKIVELIDLFFSLIVIVLCLLCPCPVAKDPKGVSTAIPTPSPIPKPPFHNKNGKKSKSL